MESPSTSAEAAELADAVEGRVGYFEAMTAVDGGDVVKSAKKDKTKSRLSILASKVVAENQGLSVHFCRVCWTSRDDPCFVGRTSPHILIEATRSLRPLGRPRPILPLPNFRRCRGGYVSGGSDQSAR
jgi:hypothetical protein